MLRICSSEIKAWMGLLFGVSLSYPSQLIAMTLKEGIKISAIMSTIFSSTFNLFFDLTSHKIMQSGAQ